MKLSILKVANQRPLKLIAILISISAICYGQPIENPEQLEKADTILLSAAHQTLLPELLKQQSELQREMQSLQEKLLILLTGYVDTKKIQDGKVQFSQDQKKIIVK